MGGCNIREFCGEMFKNKCLGDIRENVRKITRGYCLVVGKFWGKIMRLGNDRVLSEE